MTSLTRLVTLAAAAGQLADPFPGPPRHGLVYVIAHRGVHDGIPENTVAAYKKAIELGVDYVEIDVRETKDGQLVSVHNATVDAYTEDAKGPVKDFTLAELQAMDIGSRVGDEWKDERIPTVDAILEACSGNVSIYLDFKQAPPEEVVDKLRAKGLAESTVWYAGGGPLRALNKVCPECHPMPEAGSGENLDRLLQLHRPRVVASTWGAATREMVDRCHAEGVLVFVDDGGPDTWQTLFEWGVDGIQTDHAAELIEAVKAYTASAKKEEDSGGVAGAP